MKKQRKSSFIAFLQIAFVLLTGAPIVNGQSYGENLYDDGKLHKISYVGMEIQEFYIPQRVQHAYLYLRAEGGDGGARIVKEVWGTVRHKVAGGSGATIKATFKIGTAAGEIPPGSLIRMIVGGGGEKRTSQASLAGGGGGGTAVLFKAPDKSLSEFNLLMVAGGGGGAMSDCCTIKYTGRSADVGTSGSAGNSSGAVFPGGKNGNGGDGDEDVECGPGGGAFTAGKNDPECLAAGGSGGGTDNPHGGRGGYNDFLLLWGQDLSRGGYGYGAGGEGTVVSGGGGGGYSGGGVVANRGGGGGGGSYIDMAMEYIKIKNATTTNTQDGFVEYQLTDTWQLKKAIHLAKDPANCLDVEGGGTSPGTNVQLWPCNSGSAQNWMISGEMVKFAKEPSQCLELSGSKAVNAANIDIWTCNTGTNAQKWIFDGVNKSIRSRVDLDYCIDLVNGNTTKGNNIQLYQCKGVPAQQWIVDGVATTSDLTAGHKIVPVGSLALALQSASYKEMGSNIQLWTKSSSDYAQVWYFDGDQIKLKTQQTLCIDLQSSNTSNGNNIQLWKCNGTDAQKWIYNGMTRQIHSAIDPNKCMEVATTGNYVKGMNIQIMDCNEHSRQMFLIK